MTIITTRSIRTRSIPNVDDARLLFRLELLRDLFEPPMRGIDARSELRVRVREAVLIEAELLRRGITQFTQVTNYNHKEDA